MDLNKDLETKLHHLLTSRIVMTYRNNNRKGGANTSLSTMTLLMPSRAVAFSFLGGIILSNRI